MDVNLSEAQPGNIDFDSIYAGAPAAEGLPPIVPWDIEAPQPSVVELEENGQFTGDVLDIGCGRGENSIFLASRGHRVTGLDGSGVAIEQAKERARARDVHVDFGVADALDLTAYAAAFDTVLDSELYHCFPEDQRRRYLESLRGVTRPGGRLHLLCISDSAPEGMPPSRVSENDLRTNLDAAGWTITGLRPHALPAYMPQVALDALGIDLTLDAEGRADIPAWLVTATNG